MKTTATSRVKLTDWRPIYLIERYQTQSIEAANLPI
jgi:hypothetical protein